MEQAIQKILDAVKKYGFEKRRYRELGMVNVQTDEENKLLIFNYSKECAYKADWNDVELVSRGLIIDASDLENPKVIGRAFNKFFNLEQSEETKLVNLPSSEEIDSVTYKEDGSMGVTYVVNGQVKVATRGSFNSEQAIWATNYLQELINDLVKNKLTDSILIKTGLERTSLVFEIIYPENRVVLNYNGQSKLVLIGARNLNTGFDWDYKSLVWLQSEVFKNTLELARNAYTTDINKLLKEAEHAVGIEGWVVKYKNGLRVKIKTEEYKKLHRLVSGLTPKRIKELAVASQQEAESLDDFFDFVQDLPDEFQAEAKNYWQIIWTEYNDYYNAMQDRFEYLYELYGYKVTEGKPDNKKTFAELVAQIYPNYSSFMFAMFDGKPIDKLVWKLVDVNEIFKDVQREFE